MVCDEIILYINWLTGVNANLSTAEYQETNKVSSRVLHFLMKSFCLVLINGMRGPVIAQFLPKADNRVVLLEQIGRIIGVILTINLHSTASVHSRNDFYNSNKVLPFYTLYNLFVVL